MLVSDRATLGGLYKSGIPPRFSYCKLLNLSGEMSEWLKEHAWKAIVATITKRYQNTSLRNQFSDLLHKMLFGVKP